MIKRTWKETREYFNDENALIKSQHGFREFRVFGILVSKRNINFDAEVTGKGRPTAGFQN
jgi:hypothetical protein